MECLLYYGTSAVCKYFEVCGGCQWQHIDYSWQLRFKEQIIHEQLVRIGGFNHPRVMPTIGMEFPWEYRNKNRFILKTAGDEFLLGLYQKGTRDVVDIDYCHLLPKPMNDAYAGVKELIKKRFQPFRSYCAVEIKASEEGVIVFFITSPKFHLSLNQAAKEIQNISAVKGLHHIAVDKNQAAKLTTYFGSSMTVYSIDNLTFQAQSTSFFQTNIVQAERLFNEAMHLLNPQKDRLILDAYCGVGALALLVAGRAKQVIGVDISSSAISDAKWNAQLNRKENVLFLHNTLKQALTRLQGYGFDSVVLNPPREGIIEKQVLQWLIQTKPSKIMYISCNPTTLARDLRCLCEEGGYLLSRVQPVDMFPQTYHVESIAMLEQQQRVTPHN